ncbi:hypothetical protein HDV01_004181 [Terramyces sp. JEL0728]|nr:hypothetical protein HDV01_004181 [Terramyces sp. JEL0728]
METFLDSLKRKYQTNYPEYVEFYKEFQSKVQVISKKYTHQRFLTFLQEIEKLVELLENETGIGLYGEADKATLSLLCLALQKNCTVKEIGLSDCLPDNLDLLVDTLNVNKNISVLDIDLIFDSAHADMLLTRVNWSSTNLTKIYFGWVKCGPGGLGSLFKSLASLCSLKELSLVGCDLTDSAALEMKLLLEKSKSLNELDISNNKFGTLTIESIVDGILSSNRIAMLDLSSNCINDAGITAIGKLLAHAKSVKEIKLDHCDISAAGMAVFANSISQNSTLKFLSLEVLNSDIDAVRLLLNGISQNRFLTELVLNRKEDYDGVLFCKAIGNMLAKNRGLKTLHIFKQTKENERYILEGLQKNFYLIDLPGFESFRQIQSRNINVQTSRARQALLAARLLQLLPLPNEIIELIFIWKCTECLLHPSDIEKMLLLLNTETIGKFDFKTAFNVENLLNQIN